LRWRPLYWKLKSGGRDAAQSPDDAAQSSDKNDETEYAWERPISTQQTGFSVVTQSRSHLPDMVGGVCWYGVDDVYLNCHIPLYCCITEVPKPFATGSIKEFSWDSAWWVFNLTANYANLKFNRIAPEIIKVQQELETLFLSEQPKIEKNLVHVLETLDEKMDWTRPARIAAVRECLTECSMKQGDMVFDRWKQLATHVFTKYNDGYIRSEEGKYPKEGDPYPDAWLRRVTEERPEQFKVPK
jgi:dipeptidase